MSLFRHHIVLWMQDTKKQCRRHDNACSKNERTNCQHVGWKKLFNTGCLTYKSAEQASDLNLVNGLLVFLLSRFEKTFGVINHLFQTVLLLKTNTDMEIYMRWKVAIISLTCASSDITADIEPSKHSCCSAPISSHFTDLFPTGERADFSKHTAGEWKQIPTCISWKQTPCTLNTGWICVSVVLLPELARPQQSTEGQQTELWRTPLCLLFWIKSTYNHTNKSFFEIWSNNIKPCALRNYSALPLLYKTPLCSDLNSVKSWNSETFF